MNPNNLEPIEPQSAVEMYLDERREDATYATRRTIEDGLDLFIEWSEQAGTDNMNEVRGRELRKFRTWCKETSENKTVSLNGIMSVLRRFLVFCVEIEAVYSEVPEKTPMPNVPDDDAVSDEKPTDEEVNAILEFLEKHEPYSRRHVEFRLMKELGDRIGTVRAIDVRDVDVQNRVIRLRHRPEPQRPDVRGTPLKNGKDGERNQNISKGLADLIKEYLKSPPRPDVMDKFGRKPLLTTKDGRPEITTIRRDIYKLTRPCTYSDEFPHDCDPDECKANISRHASECPSSHSPHPLRRWSIEHQIESGVSKELLSDRVDVSVPVLNEHYDRRSEERKRQHRLEVLEKVFGDYGDPGATIDAGVLVDMFVNDDGSVDTKELMEFNRKRGEDVSDSDDDAHEDQLTFDDLSDSSTGVLHPALAPIFAGVAASQLVVTRLRRELDALTSRPGTSLRPNRGRMAKGAAAYSLFVGMVAFNLMTIGLTPGAII
jgi:integrase